MKTLPFILLVVVVLGCSESNTNAPAKVAENANLQSDIKPIEISAADLIKTYKENEVAADEKYSGKPLIVSGKISSIDNTLDNISVQLEGKDFVSVLCSTTKEQVVNLKKGQMIKLKGVGNGLTGGLYVGLKDCTVAK